MPGTAADESLTRWSQAAGFQALTAAAAEHVREFTGSLTPSVKIAAGRYEASFGDVGSVGVDFR